MKTILITGATDGLGRATAQALVSAGHNVIIHGRNKQKLSKVKSTMVGAGKVEDFCADLSDLKQVQLMAEIIRNNYSRIHALINNAGILKGPKAVPGSIDSRFLVNTIAPYILYEELKAPLTDGRVINVSSAAQSSVNMNVFQGNKAYHDDMEAYAQSKFALTLWTFAKSNLSDRNSNFIAVNPGSLLATKMVKEGFGITGKDISASVDLLCSLALSPLYDNANGYYFDNDIGEFGKAHPDAYKPELQTEIIKIMENIRKNV